MTPSIGRLRRGGPTPLFAAVCLVLLPALCGASPAERLARLDAQYARTGESERCLSRHRIDRVRVIDASHILFRTGPTRHWLNVLERPCPALSAHDALLVDTRTARLCDIDTVRVVESPHRARPGGAVAGPACFLGRFERLAPRDAGD